MIVNKPRIAILTNIIATYRKGYYDRLFNRDDIKVEVFCQDSMPGMNLVSIHKDYPDNIHIVKFLSAKKEKIVWQFIPWKKIIKEFDVVFVDGNPRNLSHALFASFCLFFNKRIVLATMAHSFNNNRFNESLRLAWSKMFTYLFVYTDDEVSFLKMKGFKRHHIIGLNNGLDQKKIDQSIKIANDYDLLKWKTENKLLKRDILLSSARLEAKNNLTLVLKALPDIIKCYPNILWIVIGSGDEEHSLKSTALSMGLSEYTLFIGQIYDEIKLARYFLSALIFVHPAAIGLSLLHAFGYGVPVVVHGDKKFHGPEYAAFSEGKTGYTFKKDNAIDLANKIILLLDSPNKRYEMGQTAQNIARNQYNVDIMVERFVEMAKIRLRNDTK